MIRKSRSAICIVLTIVMLLQLFVSVACANNLQEEDYKFLESDYAQRIVVAKSLEEFYDGNTIYPEEYTALNVAIERDCLGQQFSFVTEIDNKQYRFNLDLFMLDGGTIVALPQKCESLKMIQFKVENKDCAVAILESLTSGEIIKVEFAVNDILSSEIKDCAQFNIENAKKRAEHKNKDIRIDVYADIISALNIGYNCEYPLNVKYAESISSAISSQSFKSTDYCNGLYVDYDSQWQSFFSNLDQYGSATATGSVKNALMQTGWALYRGSDYFYVMQGVQSSSNERLVSISTAAWSSSRDSASATIATNFQILDSVTLSLNTLTGHCDIVFRNTGIRLEDAISTAELVGGNTYMNYSTRTHSVEGSQNFYNVLYAISSRLNVASQIWNALMPDPTITTDTVYYGTLANQQRIYGGTVRAVGNRTAANTYLWSEGTSLGIIAVYISSESFSSYRTGFAFTAYSLL